MLGSNQRPLPCEGSVIFCWRFLEVAKCLQIAVFLLCRLSQAFRIFTRVAARLLHRSRKNKGRAPFRGWLPYRYVFSSRMVNPSFL
jgi:hypothetical protein